MNDNQLANQHTAEVKEYVKTQQLTKDKFGMNVAKYFGLADNDLHPFVITRAKSDDTTAKDRAAVEEGGTTTANGYVRWDALCHLFNMHFIPKNEKDGKPAFVISPCQLINEDLPVDTNNRRAGRHISPILMAKVNNPLAEVIAAGEAHALDNSLDPTVCLFPNQMSSALEHSRSKQLYPSFAQHGILPPTGDAKLADELISMVNYELTDHEKKYYIGHILLNVQRLQQTYKSMKYDEDGVEKEDFYMYDYVKKIWDNVNEACGNNHDFKITTDFERPNIVRVVDMRYQENANLKEEDIIELNIQSNDSVVRDFSYNTSIPSALSATIAIAAQAPKNADSLKAASFGAFHQNISNRFASFVEPKEPLSPSEADIDALAESFEEEMRTYVQGLRDLDLHMSAILGGEYLLIAEGGDAVNSEKIGNHKGLVSAVTTASERLIQMYPTDQGNHYKGQIILSIAARPTSAIIPLKFTATLDGIGGIVIGNVFKLPDSRLPKGYKDAKIAFVVMGEDQKITSGQDWTTKITGQMILLPQKGEGGTNEGWEGFDFNQYDESVTKEEAKMQYVDPDKSDEKITDQQLDQDEGMNEVREGDAIYLKMSEQTHVRSSSDIDHESELDWDDNVIGLFPAHNRGLYLGTVAGMTNTKIFVMVRGNPDDPDTTEMEGTADKYYRANLDGTANKNKPMKASGIKNDQWPWYKIKFSSEAIRKFKVGWINDEDGDTDKDGADDYKHSLWTQNKQGWMRMDVLWSEGAAAVYNEKEAREEELTRLEAYKLGSRSQIIWPNTPNELYGTVGDRVPTVNFSRWDGYFKFLQTDIFANPSGAYNEIDGVINPEKNIYMKNSGEDYDTWVEGSVGRMIHFNLRKEYCADDMVVGLEKRITYLNGLKDLKR